MNAGSLDRIAGSGRANLDIDQLMEGAVRGLALMFNSERRLFCHRLRQSDSGLIQEGLSPRYTLMTLLGLHRSEKAGIASPVGVTAVLDHLLQDLRWMDNLGDLGLLLWTCSVIDSSRLEEICSRVSLPEAFKTSRAVREGRTMELAWFLSGLAHAKLSRSVKLANLADLANDTFQLLRKNQGARGIFGHLARSGTVGGFLRGRIGSFADQAYPIYALSRFAQAFGATTAIDVAKSCADRISEVQGALGQWWWHYDAATGDVAECYPVYSVHQEGMAPMALLALEAASASANYSEPIYKGLRWIAGNNEPSRDLRDASGLVWRCCQYTSKSKLYLARLTDFLRPSPAQAPANELKVLLECRPYELGWLLYAFAGVDTAASNGI